MKKLILLLLFIQGIISTSISQTHILEKLLFELPDLIFEKSESTEASKAIYELKIKQPLDHLDPSKGYFYQRAFLFHKGFDWNNQKL